MNAQTQTTNNKQHSKRVDQHPDFNKELFKHWIDSNERFDRVYDPPICDYNLPIIAGKEISQLIPNFEPKFVVTSPFRRCIQTSALLAKHFQIRKFIIDNRIGEDKGAINRCVFRANKDWKDEMNEYKNNIKNDIFMTEKAIAQSLKIPENEPFGNWNLNEAYKNITFLNENEMKDIIVNILKNDKEKEEKEKEIKIDVSWKENKWPLQSDLSFVDCCNEYVSNGENVLLVSHADIVMRLIGNRSNGMLVKPYECSWFATGDWKKKSQSDSLCRYVRYHANKEQNQQPRMEILLDAH